MDTLKMSMKSKIRRNGRRRGIAYVYLALGMLVFLGITGLVIDIGHLHMKEAQAMRAADAAALAGAMQLPDEAKALEVAREYARLNRYQNGQGGTVVNGNIDGGNPNRYTVRVERPESLFFIRVLPGVGSSRNVGAIATAEVQPSQELGADMNIGSANSDVVGPINLAVFGPQALYSHGDAYSTRWLDNGTANPKYDENGYNFKLTVPPDYVQKNGTSLVEVQIFDPDGQNLDGSRSPDGKTRIDEMHATPHARPTNEYTTTRYQLYRVVDPSDPSKDQKLGEAVYGATNPDIDMKWVTPQGFTFNLNDYGPGSYRINVKTIDGSSENGFNLRAAAPGSPAGSGSAIGTSITAMGRLPINFNQGGETTIELGTVPTAAAGKTLTIDKFDTDVGAERVSYTSSPPASNQPPGGFPGVLTRNGEWRRDEIQLPSDYTTARWFATYQAGLQDTTVWELGYQTPNSIPGSVRLIGRNGKPY